MQCHEDSQQTYRVVHKEIYIYKTNQLEKLRAAKAVYLRLHLVTFGYLWLHLVTFGYLWLPLVTSLGLIQGFSLNRLYLGLLGPNLATK